MCVIIEGAARLIIPLVNDAMEANPHGTGISWVQHNGKLAYRKGITSPKRAKRILTAIGDGTAVLHSRIATSGGNHMLLAHPFRVERFSPVSYVGRDEEFLLFHNGISSLNWHDHVPNKSGLYWSDTRTLAHALATGEATQEDLKKDGGRWLLFYHDHETRRAMVQRIGTWSTHNLHPGLWFSNLAFLWSRDWITKRAAQTEGWWKSEKWGMV